MSDVSPSLAELVELLNDGIAFYQDAAHKVADPALGETAVAGHPRLVIDDGQLLSGQTVEQRGLAHIWATDDRDFKRHERAVS